MKVNYQKRFFPIKRLISTKKTLLRDGKKVIVKAIKLSTEDGNTNLYSCEYNNNDFIHIGFVSVTDVNNLCLPCCYIKDHYNSTNILKTNL